MAEEKGVYSSSLIREMIETTRVYSSREINDKQIQADSFEPTLGDSYFVSDTVDRNGDFGEKKEFHPNGIMLEPGKCYVIPLNEGLRLDDSTYVEASARSRFGRAGLNSRLIANEDPKQYDTVPAGYAGGLSIEVTLRTPFPQIIGPGVSLNQLRFMNAPFEDLQLSGVEIAREMYSMRDSTLEGSLATQSNFRLNDFLFDVSGAKIGPMGLDERNGTLVLTNSLSVPNENNHVVYVAKDNKDPLNLIGRNKLENFFSQVDIRDVEDGSYPIKPGTFFLSSSNEVIHCPKDFVMATTVFDPKNGDFKGDHAGFIGPGFVGTLTYEPIIYESAHKFMLRDGMPMTGLRLARLIGERDQTYGSGGANVHQGQVGVRPGPFFDD